MFFSKKFIIFVFNINTFKMGRPKTGPSKEYLEKLELLKEEYSSSKITLRNVCKKYNMDRRYASEILKQQNISLRKKISSDDTIFEKINTEEKAYWLGFLYADGNVYYKEERVTYRIELGLAEKDLNHLEKFKKFLNCTNEIKYREKTKSYRLMIASKKMCNDLINLGCVPKKSLILTFPNENQVPNHLINHFIRGYFDGDGCIGLNSRSTSPKISVLGTLEFISEIKNRFQNSVISPKDKRWKNNTFDLRFNVQPGINFLYTLYNNSNIFLKRKYDRYINLFNCRSGKKFLESLESKNGEG